MKAKVPKSHSLAIRSSSLCHHRNLTLVLMFSRRLLQLFTSHT